MTVSKTLLAALITGMLSVLGAAAKAYVDVQVLKSEVQAYKEDIKDIKVDVREIRLILTKKER